jgi:anti-sigma factor RsiW
MPDRPRRRKPPACRDVVEQITAYLDGALSPGEVDAIDRHLELCPDCTRALAQWREVVALAGRLGEQDVDGLDDATRAALLEAFRSRPD